MSKNVGVIGPFGYTMSLLAVGVFCLVFSTWVWSNLYDWPAIHAKLDRLAELERQAHVFQAMEDANVGVWCELAVHYEWIDLEDQATAQLIIDSGVHER